MAYTSGVYNSPYLGSAPQRYASPYQNAMQAGIRKRRNPYYGHTYRAVPDMMPPAEPPAEPPAYREPYWSDPELRNPGDEAQNPISPLQTLLGWQDPGRTGTPEDVLWHMTQGQAPTDLNALLALLGQRSSLQQQPTDPNTLLSLLRSLLANRRPSSGIGPATGRPWGM